jgi:hypothetical protein
MKAYEALHVVLDVGYHAYGQGVTLIRAILRQGDTVLLLYCLTVSPSTPHHSSDLPFAGGAVGVVQHSSRENFSSSKPWQAYSVHSSSGSPPKTVTGWLTMGTTQQHQHQHRPLPAALALAVLLTASAQLVCAVSTAPDPPKPSAQDTVKFQSIPALPGCSSRDSSSKQIRSLTPELQHCSWSVQMQRQSSRWYAFEVAPEVANNMSVVIMARAVSGQITM